MDVYAADRLKKLEEVCRERGLPLTTQRRTVLEVLLQRETTRLRIRFLRRSKRESADFAEDGLSSPRHPGGVGIDSPSSPPGRNCPL